jgi:phage terminase large subunit-like protein
MQRLHTRDLTAVCLEQGFEHVCLPAIAPATATIHFPLTGHKVRRDRESVLWPGRQPLADLETQRAMLGAYAFAGQYQQNPVPRHEEMFRREWWQMVDTVPTRFDRIVQSWDLSFKDGDANDYVVGLVAGCVGASIYLLDRYKAKASFVRRSKRWCRVASAVQPRLEARQVFLPQSRWPDGTRRQGREWVEDFVETCAMFPKGEHDDDVDAFTQLLVRCQKQSGASTDTILRMMLEPHMKTDPDDDGEGRADDDLRYYRYQRFRG